MNKNEYFENFISLLDTATFGEVETASVWYMEAEKVAYAVAKNLDVSLEVGACIVSAFSPRERWTSNVAKAISFSLGEDITGLANNLLMAQNSLVMGYGALKGPKTNAFARAIAGDQRAVVVDVWMMRACGSPKASPSKSEYAEISEALVRASESVGLTPRTCQALIWILVRGSSI